MGYKVQVAETVVQAELERGEPTRNFLTGIHTHGAEESDEAGDEGGASGHGIGRAHPVTE